MDDVQEAVQRSLKELIASKPYKSITVMELCENAHISRKTFYTHFESKEDVVASIVRQDITEPIIHISELFSNAQRKDMYDLMYAKVYEQIYDHPEFYRDLIGPMRGKDDTFIRVATNAIYDLNMAILIKQGLERDSREADYVSYFFAASQAMLIQKWVSDGLPYTPAELASLYDEMTQQYWLSSYSRQKNKDSKGNASK